MTPLLRRAAALLLAATGALTALLTVALASAANWIDSDEPDEPDS